jgi:hypothetical protein
MSLEGDVDAGLNLGPIHIHGMAEIDAGINSILKELRGLRALEEAYQSGAKDIPLRNTGTSDSNSDSFIIGLGGPTYGRQWQVRRLTMGGVLWTSTVAGSALVVVGPSGTVTPPLPDVNDSVASLPNNGFYSTGQLIVRHPDHLRIVILTPTASTQYAVGGTATEMPDKREPIRTEQ